MDLTIGADEESFRHEVRQFIAAELTTELREAGRHCSGIYCDYPAANRWHRILARRGWSVPSWPKEYGGTGWTPMQQYIFDCEMAAAETPPITPNSTRLVAPAIIAFGTNEQKRQFLPAIRSGDDWWAQGYSEPGSGSDLASLSCSAVRDGPDYVVNGSKIWTTHAHRSNRIFCLVRTRKDDKPQKGISFLLFDLDLAGVEIRPIRSMSGEHELNSVYFRDVRVPASGLLGSEHDGWTVAKYLLTHERSLTWTPLLRARAARLRTEAADLYDDDGCRLINQPAFACRLAAIDIELKVMEVSELRMLSIAAAGNTVPSQIASMMKIRGTEIRQRLSELNMEAHGRMACVLSRVANVENSMTAHLESAAIATATYLNDRAASIYGGTNEIQRNILAKILLAS